MLFKTLSMFANPVAGGLRYPKNIRGLYDLHYEEKSIVRPYIGDQLDQDMKMWTTGRAVVIASPTGSGKTTFIIEKIVKKAIKRNVNVLVVTNRNPLNLGYKKEVAKAVGLADCYTTSGLQNEEKFGTIYVVNYQGLQGFISKNSNLHFSYVIADEVHYFLQDALFSGCTDSVLKFMAEKFRNSVRLYVSATIDEILPYITRYEMDAIFGGDRNWDLMEPSHLMSFLPFIYRMQADYSRISLNFFEDIDLVADYLASIDTQTLAFFETIVECEKFANAFDSSLVIHSKFLLKNPDVLEKLIQTEGFSEQCMATTSVFSNGNNVSKKSVRSVVVNLLDLVEIIQMVGRRRIDNNVENDGFDLYLPVPTLDELDTVIKKLEMTQTKIEFFKSNDIKLMQTLLDENEDTKLLKKFCYVDVKMKKYKINSLSEDKIYLLIRYFEFLRALISEYGPEAYCTYIAEKFGKTFNESMIFSTLEERKEIFFDFILSYSDEMSENEFEEFKEEIYDKRIKLFGKTSADNTTGKRKVQGMNAINNRLKELGIGIRFEKSGTKFKRIFV